MKSTFDSNKALSFLNVKKGRTVSEIAEEFGVTEATARKHLASLVATAQVAAIGPKTTGTRGRPATLYSTANQETAQ